MSSKGGRKKGSLNKNRKLLQEKAEELGVDPFMILLLFAKRDWKTLGYKTETVIRSTSKGETYEEDRITAKMQLDAASEACQYLESKRKAIEVSTDEENPFDVNLKLDKDEIKELVKLARGK